MITRVNKKKIVKHSQHLYFDFLRTFVEFSLFVHTYKDEQKIIIHIHKCEDTIYYQSRYSIKSIPPRDSWLKYVNYLLTLRQVLNSFTIDNLRHT